MGAIDRVFRSRRGSQERPLAAQVAALFANGEQGLWYDIEAFRSSWGSSGPELLPEGSFDFAAGWNVIEPGWVVASGKASVNNTSGITARLQRVFTPPTARWYLITIDISSLTSGTISVTHGGSSSASYTKAGKYTFLNYRSDVYSLYIAAAAGTVADIESISVVEWTGLMSCPMFQDATGSIPVYMPGQGQVDPPVGLILDRRFGLLRGNEALSNGDFSGASASWAVLNTDATHVATFSAGTLRFQTDTLSPALQIQQVGSLVVGRYYEVIVTISAYVSGSIKTDALQSGGAGFVIANGAGVFRTVGLAATSVFSFTRGSVNVDLTIDSISIRELKGNHAFQATTASRPALSARYNLLTYSDQFDNAAWAKVECSVVPNVVVGPNGGLADKVIPSTNTAQHHITCSAGSLTESRTAYVVAKADGCSKVTMWPGNSATFAHFDLVAGTTSKEASVLSSSITPLGDGWYELRATWPALTLTALRLYVSNGGMGAATNPGDGVAGVLVERADIRVVGDGIGIPGYQRVVDGNTYDAAGFPLYLKFDGVDDFLQTASLDFSASDKALVSISIRKLSDAAVGAVVELSVTSASNAGAFLIAAPITAGIGQFYFRANGTIGSSVVSSSSYAAPISGVVSGYVDIGGDFVNLRVNGVPQGNALYDLGTGGLGNYPLFIGRRGGASLPFNGRLFGLLIRAGTISDGQIQKVERFLDQKAKVF